MSRSFFNSEAVFEIVGNYPVVDQFDIIYSSLMSGSTNDNYVTGSFLKKIKSPFGKIIYKPEVRKLAFSKLGVEKDSRPQGSVSSLSYHLQPWRERAGIIRNTRIFSESERFYDSLAPDVYQLFKKLNGEIVKVNYSSLGLGSHNVIVFDNDPVFSSSSGNPFEELTSLSPVGFESTFPFEPVFSGIKRNKKISKSFYSLNEWTAPTPPYTSSISEFRTKELMIVECNSGSIFSPGPPVASFNANYWIDDLKYLVFGNGTPGSQTSKILFGFGDRSSIMSSSYGIIGKRYLPAPRFSYNFSTYRISAGPVIRGWKYGLIDGNPHYTSCVFRRDRYGQFRDMLEQRLYSATFFDQENSPTSFFGDYETPAITSFEQKKQDSKSFDPPIKVGFVKQTIFEEVVRAGAKPKRKLIYENEVPKNTWSSNLSTYATSSLPYFDDQSRNREPFTSPPNSSLITTIDNLGNISIGITT